MRRTICQRGHELEIHRYISPSGHKSCGACRQLRDTTGPLPRLSFAERFWSQVIKLPGDGCWVWANKQDYVYNQRTRSYGYARVRYNGKLVQATHVAWELTNGVPFPNDKFACHHCDYPPCIRPEHVFPGTHAENMRDAKVKRDALKQILELTNANS